MEYTKIGFYDNDTQTWSDWYAVEVGHDGNFVYDKTTDSAKVNFYSATKPSIKINQWAFLGHFTSSATTLTYDENGLPLNHEQYIVAKFEKQKQKNGKWFSTLALIEPIEAMRGVITETLSFTNQTEKTVNESGVDVTYKKDRYNCLTALERVLKVTPANNDLAKSWWARINILDGDFLENIQFDDDTFTASDLFTILFKLDDIVDRTPVLYFDMANLGAVKKYLLKFERKDGFDKNEIDYDELTSGNIGFTESDSIDTYVTGVVSEVDNLSSSVGIIYPNINMWAIAQYNEDERAIPFGDAEKGSFHIETPTKIKNIVNIRKLKIYVSKKNEAVIRRTNTNYNEENLNKYVLEKQNYLASEFLNDTDEKNKCIWYEQGTNKIYVNEVWYREQSGIDSLNAKDEFIYNIEYQPIIDTVLQYGDNGYEVSLNQNDSQIESFKYTKFLENYKKGMNKADIIFTKVYYNFNDFKDLIGSLVIKNDEQYIISNVSYKNANQLYVVAFQLNKSNLRRSANVKASEQIKPNKAIDYKNLKDRRSRYIDFIKINKTSGVESAEYIINKLPFLSALIPAQISENLCPQVVIFKAKGTLTKSDNTHINYENEYLLNFTKIINKGQIQFAITTKDNAQIGLQKILRDYDPEASDWRIVGGIKEQIPMLFTDAFGEAQQINYIFTKIDLEDFNDINSLFNIAECDRTLKMYKIMASLPTIPEDYKAELTANAIFEITNINKFKDMLEIENDNFIFNVGSDNNDIIVCQPLLELSRLIEPNDTHTLRVLPFMEKHAENDMISSPMYNLSATSTYDSEKITINFSAEEYDGRLKSIIITTNDYKKLLIINNPSETDVSNGFINIYY